MPTREDRPMSSTLSIKSIKHYMPPCQFPSRIGARNRLRTARTGAKATPPTDSMVPG